MVSPGDDGWNPRMGKCRTNGPTAGGTPQYSGDQLANVVVVGRMCFGILFIPRHLKTGNPGVVHWETHHPVY